jgi:hypothetical protein
MKKLFAIFYSSLLVLVFCVAAPVASYGQAISMNGGSIQGTVTDPSGATVPGATVIISSPATGYSHSLTTDRAGFYSLGPLNPGEYTISITASSFERQEIKTVVQLGTATSGNAKLTVGKNTETIEVTTGAIQVNTDQIGVAGLITREEIDALPINGRNALDITSSEPGVVLQSGQTFDPTKTGYSAIGVNGENGRSTRVLLDGQDISDETVGTVVYNVPEGAIGEIQFNRSTQDVSGEVTSTGQVLMSTQSGTNKYHGDVFYNFQDARVGFANVSGAYAPFQRNQYGGYVGGPIIKDKLFFFGGAERIKQFDSSPVGTSNFFETIYTQYPNIPDPFKDTFADGRLDYNGPWGVHLFARATYSNNISFGTSGQAPYALFANQDNVPAMVGGADFTSGKFTHSIRYGYLKFINHLVSGASQLGSSIYNPSTTLGFPVELIGGIYAGSGNEDAPQDTYQSSKQFRYDGTWTKGAHSIKFGGEVTRILQGGYAAFYNTFLADVSTNGIHVLPTCASATPIGPVTGTTCTDDPLNGYMPAEFVFGNGNGSGSERPAFGLPGGGDFSWRLAAYVGDTWKVTPSFTAVFGLRWSVDTDRANQDLATPTCGQVDPAYQFAGCDSTHSSTPLFDFFGPGLGLGKRTEQNYANLGPQAGFVFSPGAHRIALRGGGGIYYENDLFNNQGNVRAQNTPASFPAFNYGLITYTQTSLTLPGYMNGIQGVTQSGTPCDPSASSTCFSWPQIFGMSVGQAAAIMSGLDSLYKAAAAVPQPNGAFIGGGGALQASGAYAGPYKTPYSIQLNGGAQFELKKGLLLSVDFVHNATLKVPLTVDTNHVGAARYLNTTAAANAIAATLAFCGAANIDAAIAPGGCPGGSGANGNAIIDDFADNGLDSENAYLSGYPSIAYGLTPNTGAAFAGVNPNVGRGNFTLPVGKSAFDALQIVLQDQKAHPFPGIVNSNGQVTYNLSRAITNSRGGSNEFFAGSGAWNQDRVNQYIGRNDQDHSNMLTLSESLTIKYGLQINAIGHFYSAPSDTLDLAGITGGGQIFKSDVDGDGQTGDLIPGTGPGFYMHEVKGPGLARLITQYNATQVGTLTPAGKALVAAGLVTSSELVTMGAALQPLLPAQSPNNPLQGAATRELDASIKYPFSFKHFGFPVTLTPGISMYNVTNTSNFANFGSLADLASGVASSAGQLNGPNTPAIHETGRVNRGSGNGTFDAGGPRTTEFQLKVDF